MKPGIYCSWEDEIGKIEKELSTTKEQRRLFENIEPNFRCDFVAGTYPRLTIYNIDDLTGARALMREVFGSWRDAIKMKFFSCGSAYTVWRNPENGYEIWLTCSVEEDTVITNNCQWRPVSKIEYVYECEVKK